MKEKSPITAKEMWRITLNLTLVCFSAALILGVVFNLTEPKKRSQIAANEKTLIQKLLNLDEKAKILEVRRYLGPGQPPTIGYLLSDELRQYNLDGKFLKKPRHKSATNGWKRNFQKVISWGGFLQPKIRMGL